MLRVETMEPTIIGKSKAIENVRKQIQKLGKSKRDVLIVGEHGVGKGVVAKSVHSGQFDGAPEDKHPFVSVNASVIDDRELEAVLFGFEKGVPGMPPTTKRGLFELSDGGTVLIEEVEEASFRNQIKIMNFIEERRTKRLGGEEAKTVNARVILTTKRDPKELLEAHKLFEDLYKKLEDFEQITILPLRERIEDIPVLVKHFISEICKDLNIKDVAIDINAIDVLIRHPWRENIRELKAVIDKSVLFSSGGKFMLPPELTDEKTEVVKMINNVIAGQEFVLDNSLDVIEKGIIERSLLKFGWNQSRAATFLGMTEQTLRYKLKRLAIPSSRQRR
ncbi:MAG: sigma-54-dependent Fis family transcriptional regulator [Ignavibacteriales bacterium]|nr:sigma-54-dependent Fis family transcriptional regulator [Ignavibacteriales bacterium]